MVNTIIDAIASKLSSELGEGFTVYKERQEQGVNFPCFFIFLRSSNQKKMIGRRYFIEQKFTIEYHPGTDNKNSEIHDMVDRLNEILEYITAEGNLYRGTKMNCKVVNGILRFYVNYNFYVYKETEPIDVMESMNISSGIKK